MIEDHDAAIMDMGERLEQLEATLQRLAAAITTCEEL
jgi:hypothetical protein